LKAAGWRKDAMTKILLVQGANLTFLGRREPDIYGTTTPAELDAKLQRHAQEHDYYISRHFLHERRGRGDQPDLSGRG
jgi:Dehydroquinase class II